MSNQGSQENAGVKKPRFNPESPGPLAELEAQWLRDNKGLEVTAAQVRAILMYHGEFQKSPEREAQRRAEQEAKAKRDADREQERTNRLARLQERARKTAELAEELAKKLEEEQAKAELANGITSTGTVSQTPEEPQPAKTTTRRTKAQAEAVSA